MRARREAWLVDDMMSAYLEWCETCRAVSATYRGWEHACGPAATATFERYDAALNAEQTAAELYASLVRQVASLGLNDYDFPGPSAP